VNWVEVVPSTPRSLALRYERDGGSALVAPTAPGPHHTSHTNNRKPEEAGIEPAVANYATNGFEDREDHQIPSASINKRNYDLV